ncbi:MAG: S53 family peptidase [Actinomycetota bacterium]
MRSKRYLVCAAAFALALAGVTAAGGSPASIRIPGARPSWARASNLVRMVNPDSRVDLLVFLGWRDAAGVTAVANAVSDPNSISYGRYLTAAQFRARFSAARADVTAVRNWLSDSGLRVDGVPASRLWVAASGRARDVERALGTELAMFRVGNALRRATTGDPRVPADLAGIVGGIVGLSDVRMRTGISNRLPKPPGFRNGRPCSSFWGEKVADDLPPAYGAPAAYAVCGYTPDQLRSAYGVSDAIAAGVDGTGQTVAVIDAFASPTIERDLRKYSARHGLPEPDLTQYNVPATPGSKIENQQGWWGEETLDLESIHSLAPGASLVYLGARDNSGRGILERYEFAVDGELAQIISNSYGTAGEKIAPSGFAAWEAVFQQAAALGIGSYFSSGDCGDNKDPDGLCGGTGYITTDYSASSPWVTSVGGTSLGVGEQGEYLFETGWGTTASSLGHNRWTPAPPGDYRYGSGGGTSGLFAEPTYQLGIVPDALATRWNGRNRVVPDVAVVGDPTTGFLVGQTQAFGKGPSYDEYRIGGTSLSCPLFAAIMALADQAAGMHHGFANPALYTHAGSQAFRDIADPATPIASVRTDYSNFLNPHLGLTFTLRSYNQTGTLDTGPGYDDVTGLGSPNGQAFLDAMS